MSERITESALWIVPQGQVNKGYLPTGDRGTTVLASSPPPSLLRPLAEYDGPRDALLDAPLTCFRCPLGEGHLATSGDSSQCSTQPREKVT
jgi:hypothetical protein